jgi:hypothetical protein
LALPTNAGLILKDPEIRKYFLSILQSNLSNDEKYERFINFFELESQVKSELLSVYGTQLLNVDNNKIGEMVAAASQTIGIWKPDEVRQETHNSIRRALQRLKHSQHGDGGWGFEVEVSHPWATAYAVLCLNAAEHLGAFNIEIKSNLEKGSKWLRERCDDWSVENIEKEGSRSVYDLSIVIRACYESGEVNFPSLVPAMEKLWNSQNEDGGWDARLWPDNYLGPSRTYSEVGATSTALQALAIVKRLAGPTRLFNFDAKFRKALQWCIRTQNDDGSWNNKSCTPTSVKIEGMPSVTKTCDGIKAILTVMTSLPQPNSDTSGKAAVDKAVSWLLSQEKPLYDQYGNITGWGWEAERIGDLEIADIQNTWLTLETLVQVESESISLPLLTANAQWLMKQQHRPAPGEDSIEDGKWEPRGHTARIALSLIEFYKKIKGSPLFEKTTQVKSEIKEPSR